LLEALRRNGIADSKLYLCRQGVESPRLREVPRGGLPLRVGFFGRMDPIKGLDVLVQGFLRTDVRARLELHVHATPPADLHRSYAARLAAMMSSDSRIVQHGPAEPDQVQAIMHGYDVIAVPSQWLETGPLVAKEALAVGTPVIGSRLGGIAELIQDGVNGLLVEAPDPEAWAGAIHQIVSKPLGRVPTPPSSELVPEVSATAAAMLALYSTVLQAPVTEI
jgi:glycosyltransferase involved in cell wall biosynthesis